MLVRAGEKGGEMLFRISWEDGNVTDRVAGSLREDVRDGGPLRRLVVEAEAVAL